MENEKEIISLTDEKLKKVTGGKEYYNLPDAPDNSGIDITVIYAEVEDTSK